MRRNVQYALWGAGAATTVAGLAVALTGMLNDTSFAALLAAAIRGAGSRSGRMREHPAAGERCRRPRPSLLAKLS